MATTVTQYISKHPQWQDLLVRLRTIILNTGLEEGIKWGAPVYMLQGKNIVGLAAFKNYVALWFFNGSLLKDTAGVLVNAQPGTTKKLRQWRFTSLDDIDESLIYAYLQEAIMLEKQGKTRSKQPQKKPQTPLQLPQEFHETFSRDPSLKAKFEQLPPYKQKEFIEHINAAKRLETRQKRINQALELIAQGKGLHDRYRK